MAVLALRASSVPGTWLAEQPPALPDGVTHLWLMSPVDVGDVLAWGPQAGWTQRGKVFTD